MKKYVYWLLALTVILVVVMVVGNNATIENTIKEATISSELETVVLQVEGMTCRSCALGVEFELKQVNGVVDAKISYDEGLVTVVFDPTQVDSETIVKASTVYPASVIG